MNFNSILIVTYGRSGSTLLQGVINSIDGCLIRGENYNFCYYLFKAWKSIVESKKRFAPAVQNPWYGSHLLNDRLFVSNCKNLLYLMLTANNPSQEKLKCYGFKEIRYTTSEIGHELKDYLNFLKMIFPKPVFIFNTRNFESVVKSGWWAKQDKNKVITILQETEISFFSYIKENSENSFHITYEDIISKSNRMKKMFDFIGGNYNEDKINEVLSKPHSFKI